MTTTIMRDSIVGDDWIREMMRLNPPSRVLDATTGQPNGNILVFGRLAFCDSLFEAKPQMKSDPNSKLKHSTAILFPVGMDLTLLDEEYYRIAGTEFAQFWNPEAGRYIGIDYPIAEQVEKMKYAGFTNGGKFMTVSSNYKPQIVDAQNNVIVDQSKVYAGVWAIAALNTYASGKQAPRKGPRFGLQQLMIVADDTKLGGGAPDPRKTFAGANVKAPLGQPAAAFGQAAPPPGGAPRPPGMPPAAGAIYGQQGHGAPTAPPPAPAPAYQPQYQQPPADEDLSQFM